MEIGELREEIDSIEDSIADLFERRMEVVDMIGEVKERKGIQTLDEERESEVISKMEDRFKERGLNPEKGGELAELLIEMGRQRQR